MKKTGIAIIQDNMKRCFDESSQDPDRALDDFQKALARYIEMS